MHSPTPGALNLRQLAMDQVPRLSLRAAPLPAPTVARSKVWNPAVHHDFSVKHVARIVARQE
ncbi:hypothetical protein PSP31120_02912 [Pandoraea sputorum]|nr:hypothetical protein PSP31120_02912 [Pandoraea sputorum]